MVHDKHPKTKLEIVGGGPLYEQLVDWITRNELTHSITMHGWQHETVKFMHNWDCFVFTSLREGLPCSVVEARYMKLPVLSYDVGGVSDIIKNGKNGFLYEKHDWKSLAFGMLNLVENKAIKTKLANNREDIEEFSSSTMVRQHLSLYSEL